MADSARDGESNLGPPCHRTFQEHVGLKQWAKIVYLLTEVLLSALFATLAGAKCFTDIARSVETTRALLRRFRPLRDGTLPHDRIGEIFAVLDAAKYQRCFAARVAKGDRRPGGRGRDQPQATASLWR